MTTHTSLLSAAGVALVVAIASTGLGLRVQLIKYRLFATGRSRGLFVVLLVLAGLIGAGIAALRSYSATALSAFAPAALWRTGNDKNPDGPWARIRETLLIVAGALEDELQSVLRRDIAEAAARLLDDRVREAFIEDLKLVSGSPFLTTSQANKRAAGLKAAADDPGGLALLACEWRKYSLLKDLQRPDYGPQ